MKRSIAILSIFGLSLLALTACASNKSNLSIYPKADTGMQRFVIELPKQEDEGLWKVELFFGKNELADCNHQFYSGTLEKKDLAGWGYDYYKLTNISEFAISTKMYCLDQKNSIKFIPVKTNQDLLRYNSKLPIVIYAPKNIEVKYQFWKTQGQQNLAIKQ